MVTNTKRRCVGARRRLVASPGATRARARLTGRDSFGGRHHLLFSSGGVYPVRPTHRGTHTQTETDRETIRNNRTVAVLPRVADLDVPA